MLEFRRYHLNLVSFLVCEARVTVSVSENCFKDQTDSGCGENINLKQFITKRGYSGSRFAEKLVWNPVNKT